MEDKIKMIMAEVFVCQIEDVDLETSKDDLDNWDSLQHLIFASKIEQTFNIKLTPDEINSMTNYSKIVDIVKAKK